MCKASCRRRLFEQSPTGAFRETAFARFVVRRHGCLLHSREPAGGRGLRGFVGSPALSGKAPCNPRGRAGVSSAGLDVTVSDIPEDVTTIPPASSANMLIRTATASIEVDSLERAIAAVKKLAAGLGGYVANSGIEAGKNRLRSAVLEMKIPAPRFEEVLT